MKHLLLLFFILVSGCIASAQNLSQTIRGTVVEKETQYPLTGATVSIQSDSAHWTGTMTDVDGNFIIERIPVGRQNIKISFIGYKEAVLNNVIVTSAKEVILQVSLEAIPLKLDEVTVSATRDGDASNEMAVAGARSFSVEETQRYAGSRGDPARMASNFAGVQGADDSRNDIVIRGNSPQAVLWRMEGINIPNPNHFNIPGTAGGPVSMINNKTLANSDFYTGAFPAEFGNSNAGVFDLKLRNGNNHKHEFSGQLGFLGTELFAEGPLSRAKKSSYIFSYRYSTLAIFNKLGIDIGTNAIPHYQDMAFKLNFPLKNKAALSLFALGGTSNIDIQVSKQIEPERNIYGDNDRDQYFKSNAGIVGLSYKVPVNISNYFSATLALSGEKVQAYDEMVYRHADVVTNHYHVDSLLSQLDYSFQQTKISNSVFYSRKLKDKGYLNMGVTSDLYFFNYRDSVRNVDQTSPGYYQWRTRWNSRDKSLLVQPFIQWKYDVSDKVSLVAGLHSQYFSLTKSFIPFEPRVGLKWALDEKSSISLGAGMHSQIQPAYLYFYGHTNDAAGNPLPHNIGMGMTRSYQAVAGYNRLLGENLRLKVEGYYQHLYDVPVEKKSSSFSLLNTGAGFSRFFPDTLVNKGIGDNYGAEITLEKFFSRGYLFLVTGSLFQSRYKGSDHIWRNTDFNGHYVFNALISKEWKLKEKNVFSLGGKVTTAGGRWYGPVDSLASSKEKDVVYVDATRNSRQFAPYFRADLRISYKINRPKVSHEIALDLVNILGTKNVLKLTYAPNDLNHSENPVREEYQLGFLPLFYYRIDF